VGRAARASVVLIARNRGARRDLDLRADEVEARRLLGDGVLDLEGRVHLEEVEAGATRRGGTRRCPRPRSPRARAAATAARPSHRGSAASSAGLGVSRRSSGGAAGRCTPARRGARRPEAVPEAWISTWRAPSRQALEVDRARRRTPPREAASLLQRGGQSSGRSKRDMPLPAAAAGRLHEHRKPIRRASSTRSRSRRPR
jgi:hypothetical protein